MTIILIFFAFIIGLLVFTWIKEARILLALYHRCVFSSTQTANLLEEKKLLFPNHRLLEDNWLLIRNELLGVTEKNGQLPRFHEVDAANHKISFDGGPAWQTIVLYDARQG